MSAHNGTLVEREVLAAATTENLVTLLTHIQATRFVAAAGFTMLLYDHLLTLGDEVKYIWNSKSWAAPKYMFFVVRYGVPIAVLIHIVQMSGLSPIHLSDSFCVSYIAVSTGFGLMTIAMTNFIVLLRLWVLWDRDRTTMAATLTAFCVTHALSLGFYIYMVKRSFGVIIWSEELMMCSYHSRLPIGALWIPGLVFEVMIFVLACFNALYRPRQSNDALARVLYRDGLTYFAVLSILRILNTVLGFVAPLSLLFIAVFFVWCTTTVTTTRLVLNIRKMSADQDIDDDEDQGIRSSCPTIKHRQRKKRRKGAQLFNDSQTSEEDGKHYTSTSSTLSHSEVPFIPYRYPDAAHDPHQPHQHHHHTSNRPTHSSHSSQSPLFPISVRSPGSRSTTCSTPSGTSPFEEHINLTPLRHNHNQNLNRSLNRESNHLHIPSPGWTSHSNSDQTLVSTTFGRGDGTGIDRMTGKADLEVTDGDVIDIGRPR